MKIVLAIATIAFPLVAGPLATAIDSPLLQPAAGVAFAQNAAPDTGSVWAGRWQGTAVSGQPLVLDLEVKGERLTGKLMVGKQSAKIVAGKALDMAFALTTDKIDGQSVSGTGRQVGESIEFTIEGVKEPVMLTRIK